jgi:hypothetical protein
VTPGKRDVAVSSTKFASGIRAGFALFLCVVVAGTFTALPVDGDVPATPATSSSAAPPARGSARVLWSESFRAPLDWRDPQEHAARLLGLVYSVQKENGASFLHAHHDATSKGAAPAVHLGKAFDGLALHEVGRLRWRWRARIQPPLNDDPWQDMAAAIYVVIKPPSLLRKGRGF